MATKVFRGSTFEGEVELRLEDVNSKAVNPFPIVAGSKVEIYLKGATASVVLSTVNVGEIVITDANASSLKYTVTPTNSALLALGTSAIDVKVTELSGKITIFEEQSVLNVVDPANA